MDFLWHEVEGFQLPSPWWGKGLEEKLVAHPTQKALEVMKGCSELFSKPGDTILDPFMGSGTTGVACVLLGRKFIGRARPCIYAHGHPPNSTGKARANLASSASQRWARTDEPPEDLSKSPQCIMTPYSTANQSLPRHCLRVCS